MQKTNVNMDINTSYNSIRNLMLQDKQACTQTLKGAIVDTNPGDGIDHNVESIKNNQDAELFKTNLSVSQSSQNKVKLTRIFLSNLMPFSENDTRAIVQLNLVYKENAETQNEKEYTKTVQRLYVSTTGNEIQKCISLKHSDCTSRELILGISQRSFSAFHKSLAQEPSKRTSGSEIMSSSSKKDEHCISHAICYEGEWKNLSFCRDSYIDKYWAANIGFTDDPEKVTGKSKPTSQEIINCPMFKQALDCTYCRNNPLTFSETPSGTNIFPGEPIRIIKCKDSSTYAYYIKDFRCNEFGVWQWDIFACGRLIGKDEVPKKGDEVLNDQDGDPRLIVDEKQKGVCEPGEIELKVPLIGTERFKTKFEVSEARYEGEILLTNEGSRFWILICKRKKNCTPSPLSPSACYEYTPINLVEDSPEVQKKPKLNILFIIDNSGSMGDEQQKLKASIDTFINKFFNRAKEIDFQLAVYTTGGGNNKLIPPLSLTSIKNKGEDKEKERLKKALNPGTGGSGSERPVRSALNVLKVLKDHYKHKLRDNAFLNVIFITDAGVQSNTADDDFKDAYLPSRKIILQGAVNTGNNKCGKDDGDFDALRELIEHYNIGNEKNYFDICGENYGEQLAKFATNVINRIVRTYTPGRDK